LLREDASEVVPAGDGGYDEELVDGATRSDEARCEVSREQLH
jgi:hypothetical protein